MEPGLTGPGQVYKVMAEKLNKSASAPDDLRVDVDAVFRKKGGRIYPFIPKFIIRYLERVIHQDEINEALPHFRDYFGLDFVEKILTEKFTVDIEVVHPAHIPGPGRYIIASNHPLGGLDGMALMHVVGKKRPDLKFVVNDILIELKNLQSLFVAVNKHGRNTKEYISTLDALYSSDELVLIFPAGLVSRRQKGGISDLEWKKSFITKAVQYQRDIIPVHIDGRNSDFFYNLAIWRKRLGIKANIEMLYLADEMFKQREKRMKITFGKPIPYQVFTREHSHHQWAQLVKSHVYSLPEGLSDFAKKLG
jgi:putative hemolysin